MEISKKCPHCHKHFEGRTNKIYCSSQCKTAAFQENKTHTESGLTGGLDADKITPIKENLTGRNTEELLKLQIELRKLELAHKTECMALEAAEREKERNFELKKMELNFEQDKLSLKNRIGLLGQELEKFQVEQAPENEDDDEIDEEYDETEEEGEENDWEDEDDDLPGELQTAYQTFVRNYLSYENQSFNKSRIQQLQQTLSDLQTEFEDYADEYDIDPSEWQEYENLEGINNNLTVIYNDLDTRFFLESSTYRLSLGKLWRNHLKESIEG